MLYLRVWLGYCCVRLRSLAERLLSLLASEQSGHKVSITLCPHSGAKNESWTSVFQNVIAHWTLCSSLWIILSWSTHCVFFVFARVPVLLYLFKETWYWDSSNVTDMVMSGVKCMGNEMALSQCQYHKTVSCQRAAAKFAAGVICSESEWHGDKQKLCVMAWLFIFM